VLIVRRHGLPHKCVAGWHAPELQSESTLHADPTARPEAFGICLSLRLLPLEPTEEGWAGSWSSNGSRRLSSR
jgi:hypothetical protein